MATIQKFIRLCKWTFWKAHSINDPDESKLILQFWIATVKNILCIGDAVHRGSVSVSFCPVMHSTVFKSFLVRGILRLAIIIGFVWFAHIFKVLVVPMCDDYIRIVSGLSTKLFENFSLNCCSWFFGYYLELDIESENRQEKQRLVNNFVMQNFTIIFQPECCWVSVGFYTECVKKADWSSVNRMNWHYYIKFS